MCMERRKSQRHQLQFQLEIQGNGQNGEPFYEQAQLINISGGGALFCSQLVDRYYQGQMLETIILLPGPATANDKMKTTSKVFRLDMNDDNQVNVCIQFQKPLKLFRVEKEQNNKNKHTVQTDRQ